MHEALYIPEILDLILQHTDARTAAACARVCRTWHLPALDVVWHTIPRLDALFRLLGPMELNDHRQYCFTQPHITPERWAHFLSYAARTRHVCYAPRLRDYEIHPQAFTTVVLAQPTLHIFPNLTYLKWDHPLSGLSMFFLSPQLKSFSVRFYAIPDSEWAGADSTQIPLPGPELLVHVVARAPHLEHLEILSKPQGIPGYRISVENTLGMLHNLRSATLSDVFLTPDALSTLGLCPLLEIIAQEESFDKMPEFIFHEARNGMFPSLTEIRLQNISLSSLSTLLQSPFPAARLRRLVVVSLKEETSASISQFLTLIGSRCSSLQTLDFAAPYTHAHLVLGVPYEGLPFTALEPLMGCTELTELYIDTQMAFHLGNEELVQLVGALPQIRKLHLAPQPNPLTPHHAQLTLDVLPLLARARPEIQYLGIYIHPTSPTPTSSGLRSLPLVLENLQDLVLGTDTTEYDPDDLAFFLVEVTPPTCEFLVEYLRKSVTRRQYHIGYRMKEVAKQLIAAIKRVPIIRRAGVRYEKRIFGAREEG